MIMILGTAYKLTHKYIRLMFNLLALELDIQIVTHHLCKM